ncbi:MAG TPA: hypothetical protein VFC54_14835 [Pseudolabrys sp.]|nr:hypothetical protein [Pseudolabrys sp.]
MTDLSTSAAASDVAYSYRPSLLGAAWVFRLTEEGLIWDAGRRSGRIPYRAIRRVRLSYKPVSMQSQRFLLEVWADNAPKLEIVSSSWKSMVEQERLDKAYAYFVRELHRRIALAQSSANETVRFEHGSAPLLYWPGLTVFAGVALGLAWLTVRTLQADARGGAVFIGAFMLLFLWQGGNFFRRNRPGVYRADALPEMLMPKG